MQSCIMKLKEIPLTRETPASTCVNTQIFMYHRNLIGTLAVTSSTGEFFYFLHTHYMSKHMHTHTYSRWSSKHTTRAGLM